MVGTGTHEQQSPTASGPPFTLALVCDLLEEQWPSMDLFPDMLASYFENEHASEVRAQKLRPSLRARFSKLPAPGFSGALWNADRMANRFLDYPRWLRRRASDFDLFHVLDHSYGQLALELSPARTIVTCHDLDTFRCLLAPESDPRPRWFRAMTQRTLTGFLRAAEVICISQATRAELSQYRLFPDENITVIYPGADPVFFAASDSLSKHEAAAIDWGSEPYILHVGSTIRRKRIDVLLRVFAGVLKVFPALRLVRVGNPFTPEQEQLMRELGVADRVVKAPHLTKTQLAAVYRKAAVLLQTSDAEGFGLPVIEAQACGCPVVASDIAPLREAGGNSAEYCKVSDIDGWTDTVARLLEERATRPEQWRVRKATARAHADCFTWSENANQTIAIYRKVLSRVRAGA